MLNPISSPGDPIFYLHHTYLDKVWWGWQALNFPASVSEITGRNVQDPCGGFGGGIPWTGPNDTSPFPGWPNGTIPGCGNDTTPVIPQSLPGDPGNVTTMNHVLNMFGIVPNSTVGDVLDIRNDFLCYEYV